MIKSKNGNVKAIGSGKEIIADICTAIKAIQENADKAGVKINILEEVTKCYISVLDKKDDEFEEDSKLLEKTIEKLKTKELDLSEVAKVVTEALRKLEK